jgi:hypothetical protein
MIFDAFVSFSSISVMNIISGLITGVLNLSNAFSADFSKSLFTSCEYFIF